MKIKKLLKLLKVFSKKILNSFDLVFNNFLFVHFKYIFLKKVNKLVIFDIDNTIADTWRILSKSQKTHKAWKDATFFSNFRPFFEYFKKNDYSIVYLSARPFRARSMTLKWLRENNLPYNNVYTTSFAENKIQYISIINKECLYFDDLSHSSEKGKTYYYEEVINAANSNKKINYINYQIIKKIQEGELNIDDFRET